MTAQPCTTTGASSAHSTCTTIGAWWLLPPCTKKSTRAKVRACTSAGARHLAPPSVQHLKTLTRIYIRSCTWRCKSAAKPPTESRYGVTQTGDIQVIHRPRTRGMRSHHEPTDPRAGSTTASRLAS